MSIRPSFTAGSPTRHPPTVSSQWNSLDWQARIFTGWLAISTVPNFSVEDLSKATFRLVRWEKLIFTGSSSESHRRSGLIQANSRFSFSAIIFLAAS
jgi:hypothetical protein